MAPFHHHFEMLGWPETKVTMRLWLAGSVLAFLGVLIALL
jgi:phospho-N-acetylmuramoyl-pentapeptide-transferase